VIKAIRSGRLSASITKDSKGHPRIVDAALALSEWKSGAAKPHPSRANGRAPREPMPETLTEAQLRVAAQREIKLKLENDRTEGHIIDAGQARREAFNAARIVRDGLLNIPDRIAAQVASETDPGRVYRLLEGEIRNALTGLAELLDEDPVDDDSPGTAVHPSAGAGHAVQ
jgi:phage terminase Nu1 subunit (DNA packaging protein)